MRGPSVPVLAQLLLPHDSVEGFQGIVNDTGSVALLDVVCHRVRQMIDLRSLMPNAVVVVHWSHHRRRAMVMPNRTLEVVRRLEPHWPEIKSDLCQFHSFLLKNQETYRI